jgi:uncharacterized protein
VLRLVLDTNILISALITKGSIPDALYQGWRLHAFVLVSSHEQLFEFERVVSSTKLQRFIAPEDRQEMLMLLRRNGEIVSQLPIVTFSTDPDDNFIIATAIKGEADYLVTGDKRDILHLLEAGGVEFVTARQMLGILTEEGIESSDRRY